MIETHCIGPCAAPVQLPLPLPPPAYSPPTGGTNPTPPPPVLSAISPTAAQLTTAPVTLYVSGANFTSNSVVEIDGTVVPSMFMSDRMLQARAPALAAGAHTVTVVTDGASSGTKTFTYVEVPTITGVAPSSAPVGAITFSVNGTNFTSAAVVLFDGAPITTAFVSNGQVRGTVTGTVPGTHLVRVQDAGGTTGVEYFSFT
jgi:hypothetical protein